MWQSVKQWLCSPFKKSKAPNHPVFDDTNPNYDYVYNAIRKLETKLNQESSYRAQLFAHLGYTVFGTTVMEIKEANKLYNKGIEPYDWEE